MRQFSVYTMVPSLIFLLFFCSSTSLPADLLLKEDFESYKVDDALKGNWEVVGPVPAKPTFYIASFPVHLGEKSLRVAYPTGTNETMGIKFDPRMRRVTVECYTYPTSDKQTTFQAIIGGAAVVDPDAPPDQAQNTDAYIGPFITFANDGTLKYRGNDDWVATGAKYNRREWNKVGMEADLDTQTYSISLNDVTIVRSVPFWHTLTELNVFGIRRSPQGEGGETFYVDDLVITGSPAPVESKGKLAITWGQLKFFH